MSARSIVLIGGLDTGKTNFLARLWEALRSGEGKLVALSPPGDIKYVEEALAHLLQGEFAPRSDRNLAERRSDFTISVAPTREPEAGVEIIVPDVTGELWKSAVETSEIPNEWMEQLKQSVGALLFVRVLSEENVAPLDWVTAKRLLSQTEVDDAEAEKIPTQVFLCELLRFLEHTLKPAAGWTLPRVAVVVTAWDLLDEGLSRAGPSSYLRAEYPLFAGRLKDTRKLDVRVFGVSVVGGDLGVDEAFRQRFFEGELKDAGYVISDAAPGPLEEHDITSPVAWLIHGS